MRFHTLAMILALLGCRTPGAVTSAPREGETAATPVTRFKIFAAWLDTIAVHPTHPEFLLVGGATAGEGSYARLWNVATNTQVWEYQPFHGVPFQNALRMPGGVFSPSGEQVAILDEYGRVSILDAQTGNLIRTIYNVERSESPRRVVKYTHDGRFLVAPVGITGVKVWKTESGEVAATLRPPPNGPLFSGAAVLTMTDDDRLLFAATRSAVWVWNMADGSFVKSIPLAGLRTNAGVAGTVETETDGPWIDLSPDGRFAALVFRAAPPGAVAHIVVLIVNLENGEVVQTLDPGELAIDVVAFAGDGRSVVLTRHFGDIRVYDIASGEERQRIDVYDDAVTLHSLLSPTTGGVMYAGGIEGTLFRWEPPAP